MKADEGADQMQVDKAVLEYCTCTFLIICNKGSLTLAMG